MAWADRVKATADDISRALGYQPTGARAR
jgi:hypothetical protein